MKTKHYPTKSQRKAIVESYFNAQLRPINTPWQTGFSVNGMTVTHLESGQSFWVASLDEAREAKVSKEEGNVFSWNGSQDGFNRKYIIVTL